MAAIKDRTQRIKLIIDNLIHALQFPSENRYTVDYLVFHPKA